MGALFVQQPEQGMTFPVRSLGHLDKYTRSQTVMPDYGLFVVFTRSPIGSVSTSQTGVQIGVQTGIEYGLVQGVCESRRRECGRHALVVDWTMLIDGQQQQQVSVEYKNLICRLEQILVQSVRIQLPIELRQMPFFNITLPQVQVSSETFVQQPIVELVNRSRRQVQERSTTVLMPQKCVERLNNVECVNGQLPLFVVMPMECSVSYIRTWAQQLKVPVFGVQFTAECLRFESVEQLTQFYWQQIERVVPYVDS